MDVLGTINRHGHSTHTLAKKMGIKQSSIMSVTQGNPTAKTLRQIAGALECPIWEFFIDEMKEEDVLALLESLRQKQKEEEKKPEDATAKEDVQQATNADDLPFTDDKGEVQQPQLQPVAAFLCPHCGETIVVGLKK